MVTTYTYDSANELTSKQSGPIITAYSNDTGGNIAGKSVAAPVTTYIWDYQNLQESPVRTLLESKTPY